MATTASPESLRNEASPGDVIYDFLELVLSPLASLKLTVTLFAFSLWIVFVGTIAQTEMTILQVKSQFFESYICFVPFNAMVPKSFWPGRPDFTGGYYMPGGALIGLLLLVNLISAHVIRFKIRARGTNLAIGLVGMAIGAWITFVVILGGHNRDGIQGLPWFEWGTLWLMLKLALVALWFLSIYAMIQLFASRNEGSDRKLVEIGMLGAVVILLTSLIGYLLYAGEAAALSDSSMRILWQLIQGTLCGVALLLGAIYLFNQRAGIVVMHLGVGLLMISELLVSLTAVEQQMLLYEGETINYARDIRTTELAVVTPGTEKDSVTVVPRRLLEESFRTGERIADDRLPVDVVVRDYMRNSDIEDGAPGDDNPATAGAGLYLLAQEQAVTGGADASGTVDLPSAYVEFFEKGSEKSLGVYLLSTLLTAQDFEDEIKVGEAKHSVSLRFKRTYKPYQITLLDTERVNYEGTSKAKHYMSKVRVIDASRNKDFEESIWMNNPLRYAGETFYQSGHDFDRGREFSILQIVTNLGWMIPYVSCMIVAVGMFYHFGLAWRRFLNRREESRSPLDFMTVGGPIAWMSAVLLVALIAAGALRRTDKLPESNGMDLEAFASLPVMYEGRVQPIDTLARNSLKIISDRESLTLPKDKNPDDVVGRAPRTKEVKLPAVVWFLDVLSEKPEAADYPIFRIDHPEIQAMLELERRKGHRYSLNELLTPEFSKIEKMAQEARDAKDQSKLTVLQRRTVELTRRTRAFMGMFVAFRSVELPDADFRKALVDYQSGKRDERTLQLVSILQSAKDEVDQRERMLTVGEPALMIPNKETGEWTALASARHRHMFMSILDPKLESPAGSFAAMLDAYRAKEGGSFNKQLYEYRRQVLDLETKDRIKADKLNLEASFNRQDMFTDAMVLYLLAFLCMPVAYCCAAFVRPDSREAVPTPKKAAAWINRFSFLLIVAAFLIHSMALYIRMDLSGRPPVTNLYSSAVFIGWGGVLFMLGVELFFRFGVGNMLAAVGGFSTLIIAGILSGDGDTMKVLVAVLDTQFWLATHVVCITLGYATTFLAGLVGVAFILGGVFTPFLGPALRRDLTRITYAIICFSIFFSFVGTVLGGLWADDSWGRFWGWDPKENGALMIVIWNALVLHARWGGMIKERGMAVLSVLGMSVTAWSWFGVNELGVGLHSYGFTEGVLFTLGMFVLSTIVVACIGMLPRAIWFSSGATRNTPPPKPAG